MHINDTRGRLNIQSHSGRIAAFPGDGRLPEGRLVHLLRYHRDKIEAAHVCRRLAI
jgi:hypothetical protein